MQNPQDANLRNVTCESLTVKRPGSQSRVEVSVDSVGAYIEVYGRSTNPLIQLRIVNSGISIQGGNVITYISDGLSVEPKGSL